MNNRKAVMEWAILTLIILLMLIAAGTRCNGQAVQPFLAGGGSLLGGGMTATGAVGSGGLWINTHHLLLDPEVGYVTGGKANDADNTKSSGHTRYAQSDALFQVGRFYIGTGASWAKLYTPDYSKASWHPEVTAGTSFKSGYVNDVFVSYVLAGSDHANGMHGLSTQLYWYFGKHLFAREEIAGYWGHETVIPVSEGGSAQSVASEYAQHIVSSEFTALMGWRF